ncbi:MAG: beta-lactamase family protein [Nitrospirae bacterium]|nr:beta-lactamase family protein [Nitrospirota bacterium]
MAQSTSLRHVLAAGVSEGVFPGAVLWAWAPGFAPLTLAVGRRQVRPEALPMTDDTVFDLASLTKPMVTASLCMALADELGAKWDAPLVAWLPAFANGPEPAWRRAVTLCHLLTHSAGLPAWRPYHEAARAVHGVGAAARADILARICAEPLEAPPGTRGVYSDLGFILLGEVLERATGTGLDPLFRERVAAPLGLASARYNADHREGTFGAAPLAATLDCPWRRRVLRGVVHDDNAYVMGGVSGHAGLFASAADVGRWARAVLAAYRGDSGWIAPGLARRFLTRWAVPGSSWAMGFDTPSGASSAGTRFGPHAVGHLGYTGTSVWIDLERGWVVVLLSNRLHPDDKGADAIRRFRPLLHDSVAALLPDAPAPDRAE